MSSLTARTPAWTIIVPVKQTTLAKSRLTGFDALTRQRLAVAFAQDTVTAALACPDVARVAVVTDDPVGSLLSELGADVIPDVPNSGLNPALRYAAQRVRHDDQHAAVAALSADLPSLRPTDLSAAFRAGTGPRWFVSDLAGDGTTMLAATAGQEFSPRFGSGSQAEHCALGMVEVDSSDIERLRRDVDTLSDLWDACRRGVGRWTTEVLAATDRVGFA